MDYIAKHYCMDLALAWSIRLEGLTDQEKFKALGWGLRTWDKWYFNECDQRFGDDWRDFQNKPAFDETPEGSILTNDYLSILNKSGWKRTHIIQTPLSSERFDAGIVSAMQKKRILGVTSRYLIIAKKR